MEKFGKIMQHLIELENIPDKAEAKTKIDEYIKEIQGVMSKPVPGVDMAALDKLIAKYPPKDKGQGNTEDAATTASTVKQGGARKTRKRRKRKTKKRRRKRRKKRKTNKYRNKFTRRY